MDNQEELDITQVNVEEKYSMLTDIEHVLMRPHIYIGSVKQADVLTEKLFIDDEGDYHIVPHQHAKLTPGFVTLFNEIINNSYDEYVRTKSNRKYVSQIDVIIDKRDNSFTIKDNGGIPVQMHKEHNLWLPTMLFGHLRSGSNYTEERGATAGVNGVGASLVNIFSKKFVVETCDGSQKFVQEFENNLSVSHEPVITKSKAHGTSIYAQIDLERLEMQELDKDAVDKMVLRCLEVAASGAHWKKRLTVTCKVIDNDGEENFEFKFNAFSDYAKLIQGVDDNFFGINGERMSFLIGPSTLEVLESTALVNSIRTDLGTHVDAIADYCAGHIRWFLNKKHKIDLKPRQIKNAFKIVSSWLIDAPSFTSQTKEILDKDPKQFGFKLDFGKNLKRQLEESEIVKRLLDYHAKKSAAEELAKVREKQKVKVRPQAIKKLVDASSKNRMDCTLFIAEGDSAMTGIRKCRNADLQGGFGLGGKFVNSLNRTPAQLLKVDGDKSKDSKAKMLCDAIGLVFGQKATPETLRYGKIYIMTDADYDGYSISAQLILFLRKFWPELFEDERVFIVDSPIVVAKKANDTKMFYSMQEFKDAEDKLVADKYKIRYIKGLAAIEPSDYVELIKNPKLFKVVDDQAGWDTLTSWFNDDANYRKRLIAELVAKDKNQ